LTPAIYDLAQALSDDSSLIPTWRNITDLGIKMADIQTVSVVIASASVVIAAVYYILQIRHQAKTRAIDLAIRMDSIFESREFLESWVIVRERKKEEYESVRSVDLRKWIPEMHIAGFFGALGVLVRKKLVDLDLACNLFPIVFAWENLKFYIEKVRTEYNTTAPYEEFEYLYDEAKRRQKKLHKQGVTK
jgi:hypothetical protein